MTIEEIYGSSWEGFGTGIKKAISSIRDEASLTNQNATSAVKEKPSVMTIRPKPAIFKDRDRRPGGSPDGGKKDFNQIQKNASGGAIEKPLDNSDKNEDPENSSNEKQNNKKWLFIVIIVIVVIVILYFTFFRKKKGK